MLEVQRSVNGARHKVVDFRTQSGRGCLSAATVSFDPMRKEA